MASDRGRRRRWAGALVAAVLLAAVWALGYRLRLETPRGSYRQLRALDFSAAGPAALPPGTPGNRPRSAVLLLADGLGFSHLLLGRLELAGPNGRLAVERFPHTGRLATHEAGALVTDSAAAATTLASGVKTDGRRLGTAADGRPLRSLALAAAAAGKSVGLVTDSYFFDATMAAFVVRAADRDDAPAIVAQMAAADLELLVGTWKKGQPRAERERGGELLAAAGFRLVTDPAALAAAATAPGPLAAIFAPGSIAGAGPGRLAELAALALERLAGDPDGFFLVVESEEIDSASHARDVRRLVAGLESFDRAAGAALEFARRDAETLILATADHETGGLAVLSGRQGDRPGVRFATVHHTAAPVPLFAYGPGGELFSGAHDNTWIAPTLARLLDLPW